MAKILAKLFRDPRDAAAATEQLKKKGFTEHEIGTLAGPSVHHDHKIAFPGMEVVANGSLKTPISEAAAKPEKPALDAALSQALGIAEDAAGYFAFGISIGGVLVSVNAPDDKAQAAREILRLATPPSKGVLNTSDRSPGFVQAGRMNATDPVDAPMSGDFRKY